MKKILVLLVSQCFLTSVISQTDNAERNKERAAIENLNKEMERVFNANDNKETI